VPATALWTTPQVQSFCWRIKQQIGEGGFALAVGEPGVGKSAALRILSEQPKGSARSHDPHELTTGVFNLECAKSVAIPEISLAQQSLAYEGHDILHYANHSGQRQRLVH
jgi:hypothetical protein